MGVPADLSVEQKQVWLKAHGFVVGPREARLNTKFPGAYMVAETFEEDDLPTLTASNGPFCIVGDDLSALIEEGFAIWSPILDSSMSNVRRALSLPSHLNNPYFSFIVGRQPPPTA
jgi:hypothetical protein